MTNREIISGLRRILAAYNEIRKDDAAVNAIEEAIEKINHPTAWIPCSERLPDNFGDVLVTIDNGDVELAFYDGYYENWFCENQIVDATAWMPLPEPYKEP